MRQGTILIVTMWITLVLAALVLVLARAMRTEIVCAANGTSSLQAQAVEMAAIQYVLARLDSLDGQVPSDADVPCEAVGVGDGAFWILRPDHEDSSRYAFGITDEASKVNLNTASATVLSKLPDMTEELAAAIVDWRDADDSPGPGGVESEYYLLLDDPYPCKNADLETVAELFLVKGMTAEVLFGEDVNRNGVLDPNEDDGDASEPPDSHDGKLDCGVVPFVTVYSLEPPASGTSKVNVNTQTQELSDLLSQDLSADRASAIMALALRERRARPFSNVLDFYVRTGMTQQELETVADRLTTSASGGARRGLINVNTAPKEVLACLPGLAEDDVLALLSYRAGTEVNLDTIAWVVGAIKPDKAVGIGGLITTTTCRFSADIVSLAGDGRAFRRCRIVVDTQNSPPKVIYREDLTQLGWPLDPQTQTAARSGVPLGQIAPTQVVSQGGAK